MKLKKITTLEDIELVRSFFYKVFIDEAGYDLAHFKRSITGKHHYKRLEYYFGCENDMVVGIGGIYANQTDECWLGWFGIRPEYRKKGYASVMLTLLTEKMKNYKYKICHLYTNIITNKEAVHLYKKQGFTQNSVYSGNIITMSKSLDGITPVSKRKGKPLGFVPEWPV